MFAAADLSIVLVGTGAIPTDPRTFHAPMWLITLIGVAFALAGGAAVLGAAAAQVGSDGSLPATAPFGLRLAQFLFGFAIVASLAITGTWIALGEGPRDVQVSIGGFGFFGGWIAKEAVSRIVFGIGARGPSSACPQGWRRLTRT